jgi:hypothetical protein
VEYELQQWQTMRKWSDTCEGEMHTSEMAGDMVAFGTCGVAVFPLACETEIACALAANVVVAEVTVESLWVRRDFVAVDPLTGVSGCVVEGFLIGR